ncbi:MAG: RtcB family protein [Neisseriales bacterium]|nr:MAG: RtcB family protein [Neisseriales bacterium]
MQNVKLWTGNMPIETDAYEQIVRISELPIIANHIAIMPDVHLGKGATVGSVIPTRSAIIPAAVGVDIGCGMCAVLTNLTANDLPESLSALRNQIERDIPVGFNEHHRDVYLTGESGDIYKHALVNLLAQFETLELRNKLEHAKTNRIIRQAGTLGGGNHFIEICLDELNRVWVMLHSGSRGIGRQIGEYAIELAKEQAMANNRLPIDENLAWLDEGSYEFNAYINAMNWAQDYAKFNRDTMMSLVIAAIRRKIPHVATLGEVVNCHHNFTSLEEHFDEKVWITRKGAVSARSGEMGIIPGSMGAKSFIVTGKGNHDSYCSCSHGAGRKMSRSKAKSTFTIEDLMQQTSGIECRKDDKVIDEIPSAYKDIDEVMAAQADLVEVVQRLRQVLCIKG